MQLLQQRQSRGFQLETTCVSRPIRLCTRALTGGIGKSPDASNKDEEVLDRLRLVYKCQDAHNEKSSRADNDGSKDHVSTAEPISHEDEAYGSEKLNRTWAALDRVMADALPLTHDGGYKKGIGKSALLKEEAGIGVEER